MASTSAGLMQIPTITARVVTLARVLRITSSAFITPHCARMSQPVSVVRADLTVYCSQAAKLIALHNNIFIAPLIILQAFITKSLATTLHTRVTIPIAGI